MATRVSIATGNFTAAATWGLVDASTANTTNSELASTLLTTTYVVGTTFTPGALTITHIGVKLATRSGTTGTMSIALDQGGATVAGTEVVINTADLPLATAGDLDGGWIFLKLASPVTLLAATLYGVKAKTSSSSQVTLFTSSGSNWSRLLVLNTTGAPAAGDGDLPRALPARGRPAHAGAGAGTPLQLLRVAAGVQRPAARPAQRHGHRCADRHPGPQSGGWPRRGNRGFLLQRQHGVRRLWPGRAHDVLPPEPDRRCVG